MIELRALCLRARPDAARALLESGKANRDKAAFPAGFAVGNDFSRAFRKTFVFPPSELCRPNR